MVSEKNAMKLKHDSEMSTMHIKLDKLQRDLNYYTSNNVKLQQQLKLRSSQDSESYHSYLSTKVRLYKIWVVLYCYTVWVCTHYTARTHSHLLCMLLLFNHYSNSILTNSYRVTMMLLHLRWILM